MAPSWIGTGGMGWPPSKRAGDEAWAWATSWSEKGGRGWAFLEREKRRGLGFLLER